MTLRGPIRKSTVRSSAEGEFHGKAARDRCAMGDRGAFASPTQAATVSIPRSEADREPQGTDRHRVRAEERHSVGDAAPGDGMRFGHDMLATSARLAAGRRVGEVARHAACQVARRGQDRLVAGGR